jgi:NAD(P)-dependent dehydrogenase (short-subunit alcohol dehydrogenase family)
MPIDTKLWGLINTPHEHTKYDLNELEEFKFAMESSYLSEIRCIHVSSKFKYPYYPTLQAFIPLVKMSRGGRIAITKNILEELILKRKNIQVYKTALSSYLEQLSMDLHHTRIKVGVIDPGVFKSNYLCQEALRKRIDQMCRKMAVEENQNIVEYKSRSKR